MFGSFPKGVNVPEQNIFDVDEEVALIEGGQELVNIHVARASAQGPLRIVQIDDVSGLECDCRRPSHRPHRPMCATMAVNRNHGHPQLLFFMIHGQEYRASGAFFVRA